MRCVTRDEDDRTRRKSRAPGVFAIALLATLTIPAASFAEKPAAQKPPAFDPAVAIQRWSDPSTAASGFTMVQRAGAAGRSLAPRIEEMLKRGLPPALAIQAITTLEGWGPLTTPSVVAAYVQHRDPPLRLAAVRALSHQKSVEGASAMRKCLRSADKDLRAACATGLGAAGDKEAIPDLQKALTRGVSEAAPSIASLCVGPDCEALIARLDKLDPQIARRSFEALLPRASALGDAVILTSIEKIRPLIGVDGKTYFSALSKRFKGSLKVKRALDSAAARAPKEPAKAATKEAKP